MLCRVFDAVYGGRCGRYTMDYELVVTGCCGDAWWNHVRLSRRWWVVIGYVNMGVGT